MKRLLSIFMLCVCILVCASVSLATDTPVVLETTSFMDFLSSFLPESFAPWLTSLVALCAVVATVLPPITERSGMVYSIFYKSIQFVAFNLGAAKNNQDVRQKE